MIEIPVSIGELFDKISILEIKKNNITDKEKLLNISAEFDLLSERANQICVDKIEHLIQQLKTINLVLWDCENQIRKVNSNFESTEDYINISKKYTIFQ